MAKEEKAATPTAAQQILALKKENAELMKKLELATKHVEKVDPVVLVRYNGLRENFVYRDFDFSKGTCEMLKSQATALITRDPKCFSWA